MGDPSYPFCDLPLSLRIRRIIMYYLNQPTTKEPIYLVKDSPATVIPKYTWTCVIGELLHLHFTEDQTPCWFHKKMQEVVLGFKWKKIKNNSTFS